MILKSCRALRMNIKNFHVSKVCRLSLKRWWVLGWNFDFCIHSSKSRLAFAVNRIRKWHKLLLHYRKPANNKNPTFAYQLIRKEAWRVHISNIKETSFLASCQELIFDRPEQTYDLLKANNVVIVKLQPNEFFHTLCLVGSLHKWT